MEIGQGWLTPLIYPERSCSLPQDDHKWPNEQSHTVHEATDKAPKFVGARVRSRISAGIVMGPTPHRDRQYLPPEDDPEARGIKPPKPGITIRLEQERDHRPEDAPKAILIQVLLALSMGASLVFFWPP